MDIANIASVKVEVLPGLAVPQVPVAPVDFKELLAVFEAPVEQETPDIPLPEAMTALPMAKIDIGPDEFRHTPEISAQIPAEQPEKALPETKNLHADLAPAIPVATLVPAPKNAPEQLPLQLNKPHVPPLIATAAPETKPDVPAQKTDVASKPAAPSAIPSNPPRVVRQMPDRAEPELPGTRTPERELPPEKRIMRDMRPPVHTGFPLVNKPEVIVATNSRENPEQPVLPAAPRTAPSQHLTPPPQIVKGEQLAKASTITPASLEDLQIRFVEQHARVDPTHRTGAAETSVEGTRIKTPVAEIIAQVVNKLSGRGEQRIELRLDPPELGRVIVNLSPTENSVTATVTVERPEILDLMRRHADLLSAALEAAGYASTNLEFHSGSGGDEQADSSEDQNPSSTEFVSPEAPRPSGIIVENGRLDIRL